MSDELAEVVGHLEDVTLASSCGRCTVFFARDAETLGDAVVSAIRDLKELGLDVNSVEVEPDQFTDSRDRLAELEKRLELVEAIESRLETFTALEKRLQDVEGMLRALPLPLRSASRSEEGTNLPAEVLLRQEWLRSQEQVEQQCSHMPLGTRVDPLGPHFRAEDGTGHVSSLLRLLSSHGGERPKER